MILINSLKKNIIEHKSFLISIFELTQCFIFIFLSKFRFTHSPYYIKKIIPYVLKNIFKNLLLNTLLFTSDSTNSNNRFLVFLLKFIYLRKFKKTPFQLLKPSTFKLKNYTRYAKNKKKNFKLKKSLFKRPTKIRKIKLIRSFS